MSLPIEIVPSFPAPSFKRLEQAFTALAGRVPAFQVDVVAARFAGTASWPETEPEPEAALMQLKNWTSVFQFELDLMVSDPERYFPACASLGISRVVVHVTDDTPLERILQNAADYDLVVHLALTADVPVTTIEPYLDSAAVEGVQLMGILKVGEQGQPFDARVLPRIRSMREQFPDLSITIDGAVNETTLPQLYAAGANRFAPGSAVVGADQPAAAYKQLLDLVT